MANTRSTRFATYIGPLSAIVLAASFLTGGSATSTQPVGDSYRQPGAARSGEQIGASAAPATAAASASTTYDPALFKDLRYRSIGPTQGGRVTAVSGVPDEPATFYMGATGGGVWKTTDSGDRWTNISDGFFDTGSIGAIRVAPSDPDVVYVGTGSDGLRSNVIPGKGVYKSTDAGKTWTHLGLADVGQIGRMVVDPDDPDTVYVGAIGDPFSAGSHRGVYKSTDGGQTWEKVLYLSKKIGVYGLEMEPGNADVLYASAWRAQRKPWTIISGTASDKAGIYKSTDGGDTWDQLSGGLPTGLVGKIDLSISPDMPERVYALVEAPTKEEGLYRSDDAGESWDLVGPVTEEPGLMARPFYYDNVDADPTDADTVYVLNEGFYRSTDGGQTWEQRPTPHGDNHDMWINPDDPDTYIEGNDGGANVTLNDGETWSTQYNQPTAELYEVDVSDTFPFWACAGQQDDGTICVPNVPPGTHSGPGPTAWWRSVAGCETGPAVPKPGDPSTVYGNCKGKFSVYDFDTGQEQNYWVGAYYMYGHKPKDLPDRFQRVSPIEVSPHDPNVIYHGSQYVYRTRNEGRRWTRISPDLTATPPGTQGISGQPITRDITGEEYYSTTYAIEESPVREGVIWVGSNDGPFNVTRNGGGSWKDVTPSSLPPGGRVKSIEPSPHDAATAYYATYRFLLGDYHPYIYRTENYGRSWKLLTDGTNGIPADVPTRTIREDPVREGLLYAGTDAGMYVSFDDGAHWQSLQQNLPSTPVTDIEIVGDDMVLSTMGRGFWVMDDITVLRQLTRQVSNADVTLYDAAPAYRTRYPQFEPGMSTEDEEEEEGEETASSTSRQAPAVAAAEPEEEPKSAFPVYPPVGANIDYYLADPAQRLRLRILDRRGRVIRAFSSESAGGPAAGTEELPTEAGHHRIRWDLALPGPWDAEASERGEDGPLATPGRYRLRLVADGRRESAALTIRIDPRLPKDGVSQADLVRQLGLNLRIRDALSQAKHAAARIDTAQRNLEGETAPRAERARRELGRLESRIVTDPTIQSYPQPMLIDQIDYLYGMTTAADQALGRDAFVRYRQVHGQVGRAQAELDRILRRCGGFCT